MRWRMVLTAVVVVMSLEEQGVNEAQTTPGVSSLLMEGSWRSAGPQSRRRTVVVSPGVSLL